MRSRGGRRPRGVRFVLLGMVASTSSLGGCEIIANLTTPLVVDRDAGDAGANEADAPLQCAADVDLSSPHNCARCGRDCVRGECVEGRCTPYVIASGQNAPWYIAVDEVDAYWTSFRDTGSGDGTIHRVSKVEGGEGSLVVQAYDVLDLVISGPHVIFTSYGYTDAQPPGIFYALKTGGQASPLYTQGVGVDVIHNGDAGVFASVRSTDGNDSLILALEPGKPTSTLTTFGGGRHIEGLARLSDSIYFVNQEQPGSIGRIGISGLDQQLDWQPNEKRPERIVVEGDDIFWTQIEEGVFRRNRTAAKTDPVLSPANVQHGGLAVDKDNIYVAVQAEGRVVRVDRQHMLAHDVATGLDNPIGMTQDETAIYFVTRGSGNVYRMVK